MPATSQPAILRPPHARPDPGRARQIVESYQPMDIVDTHYKERYLDLIDRYPHDFGNRYNYTDGIHGHITSQAFVLHPNLNAVALIHHIKLGLWLGQGGHMEPADVDFIATARREAEEEGGFKDLRLLQDTPFDLDVHGFPAKGPQPDHIHYDMRWLFVAPDDQLRLNPNEGAAIEWVKIADLRDRMKIWLSNSRLIRRLEGMVVG
jgi:8-oxo-dGTP pyrophosphatase MutT (NUDIX family)